MSIDPRSFLVEEPEERDFTLLPNGEYPWRIVEINAMTTARTSGNPMIPIKFEFHDADGNKTTVYENLVFSEAAAWKVNQFLKSANGGTVDKGRRVNFEDRDFLKWLASRTGTAKLGTERVNGKTKEYDRNKIEAFTWPKDGSAIPAMPTGGSSAPADDDEIPF